MARAARTTDPLAEHPEPSRKSSGVPLAAVWVLGLSALVIGLDVVFPEQITVGVLYVLPILAGISLDSERALYVLTGIVILAIFTFFVAFPTGDVRVGLINRILSSIAMLGVAYLVGRQIRINRELQEQKRRLAQLMELQTDFVRAVSHDIRAPIGAVLGYVELLESAVGTEPMTERQVSFLRGIRRSCRNVVALTDNLLTTAKLDSGEFPVEHVPFDLTSILHDVVGEMISLAGGHRERIRLDAPPSLSVTSDPLRVRQILVNLTSNALKYSPSDQCVRVVAVRRGPSVCVSIADQGPGIPPDERERIFEPFYQSAARRKRGGVGLGLPLARRLARALGGDITLESTIGKGSVFTLELPSGA